MFESFKNILQYCRTPVARNLATFALTAGAAGVFVLFSALLIAEPANSIDFTAFYCAGKAIAAHADPYTALALWKCEHAAVGDGVIFVRNLVLPAPLPPYDLAAFGLISHLPFVVALVAWRIGLVLAVGVTAIALRALSGLAWPVIILALIPIDLITALALGQPVPLLVAAIALSAWALQRGNDRLAAVLASGAMIEPHVGLAGCLALFCYRPATRPVLVGAALIAVVASVVNAPLALTVEYFIRVLPQHAHSEVTRFMQYSLTHALWVMGASPSLALFAGWLSYLALLIVGLVVVPRLTRVLQCPALLVAFPAALAVFGGSFIHLTQIVAALPAAVILTAKASGWPRTAAAISVLLLTFSGTQLVDIGSTLIALVVGLPIAAMIVPRRLIAVVGFSVIVGIAWLALRDLPQATARGFATQIAATVDPTALSEDPWERYTLASDPGPRLQRIGLLVELPTFFALTLVLASGARVAFGRTRDRDLLPLDS